MNKFDFKDMMIEILKNERSIYASLENMESSNRLVYHHTVTAIDLVIKHLKGNLYDETIEKFCEYFEDEILKETEKQMGKKGKKKAE